MMKWNTFRVLNDECLLDEFKTTFKFRGPIEKFWFSSDWTLCESMDILLYSLFLRINSGWTLLEEKEWG